MGTGPKKWTEALIDERVKDGRGKGVGDDYKPWIYIQEFSSRGNQTRIPGVKFKRTVHTMSYMERRLFLLHEFLPNFVSYLEQYPMERRITLGAAAALGIRHPVYPGTKVPVVMTLDAVVTLTGPDGRPVTAGWDAKPEAELLKPRVLEKMSLHKAYCRHVGMEHFVFTERTAPTRLARNIDLVRMSLPKDGEEESVPGLFTVHPELMLDDLELNRPRVPIWSYCERYDALHQLPLGTGLRIFKCLIWHHRVKVDMTAQKLELLQVPAPEKRQQANAVRRAA